MSKASFVFALTFGIAALHADPVLASLQVSAGDVTSNSIVLWARSDTAGPITFEVATDSAFTGIVSTTNTSVIDPAIPVKSLVGTLAAATQYFYRATQSPTESIGSFRTSALPATGPSGLSFGVTGDWRGELSPYPAVMNAADADLDFFAVLGDTIYADYPSPALPKSQALTLSDYRIRHDEAYSVDRFGLNVNFLGDLRSSTAMFAGIDDHEVINDFAGGAPASSDVRFTETTGLINETQLYSNGLQVFHEYNPINSLTYSGTGDVRFDGRPNLYRQRDFGQDASCMMLDARSFRDQELAEVADITDPAQVGAFLALSFDINPATGQPLPPRTMLGAPQLAQLQSDLLAAQAAGQTWKFVMVPEPIQNFGPLAAADRFEGYAAERRDLLKFIDDNGISNVVFVCADIHGTLTNNLTYQMGPGQPQIPTSAFEISTGSVAFDAPFGQTVAILGQAAGLIDAPTAAFYNSLPIAPDADSVLNDKDDVIESVIDSFLAPLGYDPLGLDNNLPVADGLIDATLLQGSYVACHTFGWSQFEIDPVTQELTVTTYGIEPYTQAEMEGSPSTVAARTPSVVSQFKVAPKLAPKLLITEINSNGSEDFWELTNLGVTSVDLSGWSWDDDSGTAGTVVIPNGTMIDPGEAIVFTGADAPAFRSFWGLDSSVQVITGVGAPGFGNNDGVFLFDASGNTVSSFSYAAAGFVKSDGSPSNGGHAGLSAGGASAAQSAVLDPSFGTDTPRYTAADGILWGTTLIGSGPVAGSPGESGLSVAPPAFELTLSVSPSSFSESAGNPAATGTVTRTGATTSDLVVNLASGDETEVIVPSSVTILAGSASADFDVTAVDDSFPDGDQTLTISASAADSLPDSTEITVTDDGDTFSQRLLLTEVHSSPTGVSDYWELTNFGATAVDLSGYTWHDSGRSYSAATGWALPSGSSIAPGESVIFTENDALAFRAFWNLPASVQIFQADSAAPGLGKGDGVSLFNASGNEIFYFSYAIGDFTLENGEPSIGESTTANGHAGLAAGGTVDQAAIWVPSSGFDAPRYTAATGTNYGTVVSGTDTGSPGSLGQVIDLSLYVRVGRYDLPEYRRTALPAGTPTNNLLCDEASAVTYNWDTDTLFITGDGGSSITQVSKTGVLIDTMTLATGSSPQGTAFYDPEGLTYLGGGEFVLTEERDRQLVKFTYAAGTTLTRAQTQTVKLGTFDNNTGTEGVSFDPMTGGFIALKEKNPIGVFQTDVDFANGTASNGSATAANSLNLFDTSLLGMTDVADVFALSNLPNGYSGNLLVLGQEDARIVNIDRSGNILNTLQIVSDLGNPLSAADQQHEGLTMDSEGNLYVVNENGGGDIAFPQLWVYAVATAPNAAPTAVALNNPTTSVVENTNTFAALKVADLIVTDDGLGVNEFTVTGPDAASFEVVGNALFIKAGTVLDFETQSLYQITVEVNDTTVGTDPDASVGFTLTVTDVIDETLETPAIIVSEVAPWSSGNSPVIGQDWFELTNTSDVPIDITGWKFDDDSANLSEADLLSGITSIAPGESVIFVDTGDVTTFSSAAFLSEWFGSNPPSGLQVGSYAGAGLSTGGDAVFIFDAAGNIVTSLTFGASPGADALATFDNSAGVTESNLLSEVGAYGAFLAANGNEVGSPGTTGGVIITEAAPWSSGGSLKSDWFELTNFTARSIDISTWRMDDSSESASTAVPLNGVTSIAPGESVIFIETATPEDLATTANAFRTLWFGNNSPAGLQIGSYSGGGVGLSGNGDAVNLFDLSNTRRARMIFGASPTGPFATFDNVEGNQDTAVTQLSEVGVNGAFVAINQSDVIGSPGKTETIFTLQILHYYGESGLLGIETAPLMGAMIDRFDDQYANTLVLGEGDSFIPGPWLIAGADPSLSAVPAVGRTALGRPDIAIMNAFGTDASALGNHEFDLGSPVLASAFAADRQWLGAQFPFITANLDFSADSSLRGLSDVTLGGTGGPLAGSEVSALAAKIAPYAISTMSGEPVGIIGATNWELLTKTSPNGTVPKDDGNPATDELMEVATYLQGAVDQLALLGVNKVIMVDQLDTLDRNKALAGMVSGIDIMVAGGGHERMGDSTDTAVPFSGHDANFISETYPIMTADASGNPTLIVTTDTEYTYLGRLVADFDSAGRLITSSLDENINGAYASSEATLQAAYESTDPAADIVAASPIGSAVQTIVDAIEAIVISKDSTVYGYTDVYLEGDRVFGRTQEVNLGDITADANAWKARNALGLGIGDSVFSLKNGGGIRASIGSVLADGTKVAPFANSITGKPAGGISQLDVENALRFNNKMMVFDTTPDGLLAILEFTAGLSSGPTQQNGGYPQVGNLRYSYDYSMAPGTRVRSAALINEAGEITALIAQDGVILPGAPATIPCVALNFTANGGDGYPIKSNGSNFRYLLKDGTVSAAIDSSQDFTAAANVPADALGEQQAFADFLADRHPTAGDAYAIADTPVALDQRIQQLAFRMDGILLDLDLESFAAAFGVDPTDKDVILAYAFGLNPDGSSGVLVVDSAGNVISRGFPAFSIESTTNQVSLSLTFLRRKNADEAGLDYSGEYSADLEKWFTTDKLPVVIGMDGEMEVVRIAHPFFTPTLEKSRFFRMRVSRLGAASTASRQVLTPNTLASNGGSTSTMTIVNYGMVGAGRLSGDLVDEFGETLGAASGLFVTGWDYDPATHTYSGVFNVLPDRGFNANGIFSNYAARIHEVDFTFTPYFGAGPVAPSQLVPTYRESKKFIYDDAGTIKFTTGLNPTGVTNILGQPVGTVSTANGPGGTMEDLVAFDAEALHLFADGAGYVSDEYGAYLAYFDANKEIQNFIQLPDSAKPHSAPGTLNFNSTAAPLTGRRNNQGLEGMSVTPDGNTLIAVMQSALIQDNGTGQQGRKTTRVYVFDISSSRIYPTLIGEYALNLPQYDLNGNGSGVDRTASQSEVVALDAARFLMLPRDGNGLGTGSANPGVIKSVELVDLTGATNIVGLYDAETDAIAPGGVLDPSIVPAESVEIINLLATDELAKFGFNTNNATPDQFTFPEKMEGFGLVPDLATPEPNDFYLFVANDNDFQSTNVLRLDETGTIVSEGDQTAGGITNDAVFIAYRIVIR